MKKLFILLVAFAAFSAGAQSLKFIYNGAQLENNSTIDVVYTADDCGMIFDRPHLGFVNTGSEDVTYSVGLRDLNVNAEHNMMGFCVGENCCTSEGVSNLPLAAGEVVADDALNSFHPTIMLNGMGETSFKIYARNQNDPSDEAVVTVRFYYGTSIAERSQEYQLNAYPNPATTAVTVQYNPTLANGNTLVIRNIAGAVVYRQDASVSGKMRINTTDLKSGIYFYGLEDGNGRTLCTKKLLVK